MKTGTTRGAARRRENDPYSSRAPRNQSNSTARKGTAIVGPALVAAAGVVLLAWSVTRPIGNLPGMALGLVLALYGGLELRHRLKVRQIARRADRRRGYVR